MSQRVLFEIAVVQRDDCFLVGRRPPDGPLAGKWEFPGGKLEEGETAEQAARRECFEETGLTVDLRALLAEMEHTYAHGSLTLAFFLATVSQESRHTSPRLPFQWMSRSEVVKLEFPPANAPILRMLAEDPRKILAKEMI